MSLEFFAHQIITTPPSPAFTAQFLTEIEEKSTIIDFQLQNTTFLHGTTLFGLICRYQHYDVAKHFINIGLGNDSIEISSKLSIFTVLCAVDPIPVELFHFLLFWYESTLCAPQISFTTLATWLSHPIITTSHIQFALLLFKRIPHTADTIFDIVALITNSIHFDTPQHDQCAFQNNEHITPFTQTQSPFTTPQPKEDSWLTLFRYNIFLELESFVVQFFTPELITSKISQFYYQEHSRLVHINAILQSIIRLNVYLTSIRKYGPIATRISQIMSDLESYVKLAGFDTRNTYKYLSQVILTHEYFVPHYMLFRYNFPINQYTVDLFDQIQTLLPIVPNYLPIQEVKLKNFLANAICTGDSYQKDEKPPQNSSIGHKLGLDPMYSLYPLSQPRNAIQKNLFDFKKLGKTPINLTDAKVRTNINDQMTEPAIIYESDPRYRIHLIDNLLCASNSETGQSYALEVAANNHAPKNDSPFLTHPIIASLPSLHQFSAYPILPPLPVYICSIMNYFIHTQYPMVNTAYTLQFKFKNLFAELYQTHQLLNTIPQLPNPFNVIKSTHAQVLPSENLLDSELTGNSVTTRNDLKYSNEYRFIHTPAQFRLIPRNTVNNSLWPPYLPYDVHQNPTTNPLPSLVKHQRAQIKAENHKKDEIFHQSLVGNATSGVHIEGNEIMTKHKIHPVLYPSVLNDILYHHETMWTPEHLNPINKSQNAFQSPQFAHITGSYSPYDIFGADNIVNIPRRLPFPFLPWQSWNRMQNSFVLDKYTQYSQDYKASKEARCTTDYASLTYQGIYNDDTHQERIGSDFYDNNGLFERHFTVGFGPKKKGLLSRLFGGKKDDKEDTQNKDPSRKESYIVNELYTNDDFSDFEFEAHDKTHLSELKHRTANIDITVVDNVREETKKEMTLNRQKILNFHNTSTPYPNEWFHYGNPWQSNDHVHNNISLNSLLFHTTFIQVYSAMKFFKKFLLNTLHSYYPTNITQYNPVLPYITHPLRIHGGYVSRVDSSPNSMVVSTSTYTRSLPLTLWTVFDTNFNKNISSNQHYISIYDYTNPKIVFDEAVFRKLINTFLFWNFAAATFPACITDSFEQSPSNAFVMQYQYGIVNNHHLSFPSLAYYYRRFSRLIAVPLHTQFNPSMNSRAEEPKTMYSSHQIAQHTFGYLLSHAHHLLYRIHLPLYSYGHQIFASQGEKENKLHQDLAKESWDRTIEILNKRSKPLGEKKKLPFSNRQLLHREPKSLTEININFESNKLYDISELTLARNGMLESLMSLVHILMHNTDIINVSSVSTGYQFFDTSPHLVPTALQGFLLGYAESSSKLWNPFLYIFFRNILDRISVELPKHYFSIIGRNIFTAGQQLNTVLGYNAVAQDKTHVPKTFLNLISTHGVPLDIPYLNDAMRTLLWSSSRHGAIISVIKSPLFLNGTNTWSPLYPQMFTRINLSLWDWMSPAGISLIYFYLMWFVQIDPPKIALKTEEWNKHNHFLDPFFQFVHKIWIFFPFLKAYHRLSVTSNAHATSSLYPALLNTPYKDGEEKKNSLHPYTTRLRFPILSQCVQDSSIYTIHAQSNTSTSTITNTTPQIVDSQIQDELCPYSSIPSLLTTLSRSSPTTTTISHDVINNPLFDAFGCPVDLHNIPENQKAALFPYLALQNPPDLQLNPFQTNLYADHTFHYNHQNTTQFFSNCVNSNTFTSTPQPDAQIDTKKENQHLPSPNFCSTDPHNSLQFNNTYDHLRNKSTEYQLQVIEDLIHHLIFVSFETPVPPSQQKITQAYHSSSSPALPLIKRDKIPTPFWTVDSTAPGSISIQLGDWMMALNKYDSTIQQYVNYPIINTSLIKYFFFSPLNPYLSHLFLCQARNLPGYKIQLLKQRNHHKIYHNLLLFCLMGWDSYAEKELTEGDYVSFWKPFFDILLQDPNIDTSISLSTIQSQSDGTIIKKYYFHDLFKQVQLTYHGDIKYDTRNSYQDYFDKFEEQPSTYLHNNLLTVRGNHLDISQTHHLNESIYRAYDETSPAFFDYPFYHGSIQPGYKTHYNNIPLVGETISHFFAFQEPFRTPNSHITHSLKAEPFNSHFSATSPHNINNAIDGRATLTKSLIPPLFNVSYQTYPSRLFQSKLSGVLIDLLSALFGFQLISIAQNILVINHTLDFTTVSTALGNASIPGALTSTKSLGATLEIDPVVINTHSFRTAGGLDQNSPANHFPGAPAFKQSLFRGSIMEFLTENGFINGYQYALHFITQSHYDRRSLRTPSEDISDTIPLTYLPSFDGLSVIFDNPVNNLIYVYGTPRELWYNRPMYTNVPVFYVDILRNFIQSILAKQYSNDLESVRSTQSIHNISTSLLLPQTHSPSIPPNAQSMPYSPSIPPNASTMQRNATIGITELHLSLLNMLFLENDRFIENEQGNLFGDITHPQWNHGNRGGQPLYVNGKLSSQDFTRGIDRRKIFYNNNYEPNCVFLIQESLSLLLHYYSLPITIEFISFVEFLLEKATYIQPGVLFAFLTNSFQQHSAQYFSLYQRLIKYLTPPNDALFQHLTQMMTHTPIITLFGPLMGSTTLFTNQYTMQIIYSLLSFGMPFDYPYTQRDQLSNIAVSGEEYRFSQALPDPAHETNPCVDVLGSKQMSQKININIFELYNGPQLNESAILAYLQWSNLFSLDTSLDTQKLFSNSNCNSKLNNKTKITQSKLKSGSMWPLPTTPQKKNASIKDPTDEFEYHYFNKALVDPRSTFLQLQLDPARFSNELSQPAFTLLLTLAQVDVTQLRSLTITSREMEHKMTQVERKYAAAQQAQNPLPDLADNDDQTMPEITLDSDQQVAWSTLLYERAVLLNTQPELRRFCRTITSIWFYNSTRQYSTSLYSIGLNRELNTKFSYRGMPQQYNRQYLDLFPANRYKTISHAMMYNTSSIYQHNIVLSSILKPFLSWANLSDMFEQHFMYPKYADLLAKQVILNVNPTSSDVSSVDQNATLWSTSRSLLKVNDVIISFPGYTINPSIITNLYQAQTLDQFLLAYADLLYQMKSQVIFFASGANIKAPISTDALIKYHENSINPEHIQAAQSRQFTISSQRHVGLGDISVDLGTQPDFIFYDNVAALVTEQDLVTPNPNLFNWLSLNTMPFGAKPCLGCFHKVSSTKPVMFFKHLTTPAHGTTIAKQSSNHLPYSSCFGHSHQHWSCLKSFIERSVYSIKTPPHETVHEMIQWILQTLEKRFQFDPYSELYYHYLQSIYIPGYGVKELPPPVLISPIESLSQVFQNCDPNDLDAAVQDWDQSGYSHVTSLYNEPFVNDSSLRSLIAPQRKATYNSLEAFSPKDPNTLEYQTQVQSKMGSLNYNEQRLCLSSATDVTSVNTVELYAPTQMDIITPEVLDLLAGDQCTHSTARDYFPNALYAPRWKSLLTYLGEDTAFQIESQNEHILPKNYSIIDDLTDHAITFPVFSHSNKSISDSNNFVSVQNSLAPLHPPPLHPTYPAPLHPAAAPFLPTSQLDDLTGFFFYILNNVAQPTIDDLLLILQVNPQTNHQKLYQLQQNDLSAPSQSIFSSLASSMVYPPTQQTVLMLAVLRRWSDECLSLLWNFVINQGVDVQDIIYQSDRLGFNIWDYVVMTNIQFSAPNFYELIAPYFPSEPPQ